MPAPFLVVGALGSVSNPLLLASASAVRGMWVFKAHSYAASKRVLVGKLVDEIARVAPKREVGSVVVVAVVCVGAGTAQALAVAVLLFDAIVTSTVGAAGGGAEGVQWDVGWLACAVAADVERNLGGRQGCREPSPTVEAVVWAAVVWLAWAVVRLVWPSLLRKAESRWDGVECG